MTALHRRGGTGGGGGGLTLGPPQNEFTGANKAAAETARDTYATANATWLAQYDNQPTYVISLAWPASTPTTTIYQARRGGSWADVTGLVTGPKGGKGDKGDKGDEGDPPSGNATAYSYLVKPALTAPNVTTDTAIAASGDGYKHTLVDEYAAPAGIEPGADFITEWEGSIAVQVASTCNLQIILRTTHEFGSPEKTLVHERSIFHDLAQNTRQTFSLTEFFSRSTPVAGTFGGVTVTRDDIEGTSKITYELELRTFDRRSETDRATNTIKAFTGANIETASYQLRQAVEIGEGFLVDALVFWSPTTQHADADRVRFGDTVTVTYGGTDVTADIYNASRDGHIVTLIMEPLGSETWSEVDTEANVTVSDSDGNQFGSWITESLQNSRDDVTSAGQWFRAIEEAGAGQEVWREIDRIDEVDDTHLSVGDRTGTTLELLSSTGDDVLLPSATTTEAGLESAEDQKLLLALPPRWTPGTYGVGTERSWAQKIYQCISPRTVSDTDNPAADTTGWATGATTSHTGVTNLSVGNRTATSLDVESDTGTDATLPSASQTEAGLQSSADKTKLDGIATGAQVNVQADWDQSESTAGNYIQNKPTIPDTSSFRTAAQITAEITAALADGPISDGGVWDASNAYAIRTLVNTTGEGAATYLSRAAVVANTAATSEPGVGSAWEDSWLRIGYQDGPPNAFIDAAFAGRHLTFSREGGENPQTLEVPIGTGQLVLEEIGRANFVPVNGGEYVAEADGQTPIDLSDVQDTDILAAQLNTTDSADLAWFTGADINRNAVAGTAAGGRAIDFLAALAFSVRLGRDSDDHLLYATATTVEAPTPFILWRAGGTNAPVGSTRVETISFQAAASASTEFEAQPLATDPLSVDFGDGANQIITGVNGNDFTVAAGVYVLSSTIDVGTSAQNAKINLRFRNASDNSEIATFASTRANNGTPNNVTIGGVLFLSQQTTVNIEVVRAASASSLPAGWHVDLARWGGGVTGFSPGKLGTATFELDGTATDVQLMDDTTSAPIVCPADGWIIAVVTVPGLGLNGSVSWMLADDLRSADSDDALTASLYTNAQNQVFFGAGDQDGGATTGNRIILHHTGTVQESSGGAAPVVLPTILEFTVTGDATVTDADISNKRYSFVSRISQSAHVGSARIVGFLGTAANPSNVDELEDLTDFFHDSGSFQLPASRTLAAVNDIYTIRLEVYPTGVPDTSAPTIYHDFRIKRVAPSGQLHFGYVRGGADYAAAALLVDFANDIGDARDAVPGNYTVDRLPEDSQLYRLYWAVPDTFPQPTGWTVASFPITNSLDTVGQSRTIGGVDYTIYITDADYDSTSNAVTTIAVTTG